MAEFNNLVRLTVGGHVAHSDAFAMQPNDHARYGYFHFWFLSLLGSQVDVRAIWAKLLKGESAQIEGDRKYRTFWATLAPGDMKQWKSFRVSLPSAAGHQLVLVHEKALYGTSDLEFILLPRQREQVAELHYRYLNHRLDVPLHPSWAAWLFARADGNGEAKQIESRGIEAYHCMPYPAGIARDVGEAIRRGELKVNGVAPRKLEYWEMTQREFMRVVDFKPSGKDMHVVLPDGKRWLSPGSRSRYEAVRLTHRSLVGQAIQAGKFVPSQIRAEYPELKKILAGGAVPLVGAPREVLVG